MSEDSQINRQVYRCVILWRSSEENNEDEIILLLAVSEELLKLRMSSEGK